MHNNSRCNETDVMGTLLLRFVAGMLTTTQTYCLLDSFCAYKDTKIPDTYSDNSPWDGYVIIYEYTKTHSAYHCIMT